MKHTVLLLRCLVLILMGALGGCASIANGTHESLAVQAISDDGKEVAGANCDLVNIQGKQSVVTPGSVDMPRTHGDLTINCTKDGLPPGTVTAKASFNKTVIASAVLVGGIGVGIDFGSGAAFKYPERITVHMGREITVENIPTYAGGVTPRPATRPAGPMIFGARPANANKWQGTDDKTHYGVLIAQVYEDTPAKSANILNGDVIYGVNDTEVVDNQQFSQLINRLAGHTVRLTIQRGDVTLTQNIALNPHKAAAHLPPPRPAGPMLFGVWRTNVKEWQGTDSKLHYGVLITEVYEDTPAKSANILNGDIIYGVNDTEIIDNQQFTHLINMLAGQTIHLRIQRSGVTLTQDITLNPKA
jgi:hypothetical protein